MKTISQVSSIGSVDGIFHNVMQNDHMDTRARGHHWIWDSVF